MPFLRKKITLFILLLLPLTFIFLHGEKTVVHAQTTGHRVSGQVLNIVGPTPPAQCPSGGYDGLNEVVVGLSGAGGTFSGTTGPGGSGQQGAFYIENVPDGLYNLCITTLPGSQYQYYCSVQSWQPSPPTPTRDPFQSQCIRVNVQGGDVAGLRMAVRTIATTSGTPTVTTTTSPTQSVTSSPSPTGQQSACGRFEDVPTGAPFYANIQCLACNGSISGYGCGAAPAGSCVPPDNLPYFLPGNDITRAQMMKIIVMSARYSDTIGQNQQTFSDVPTSHPFWLYIEQAFAHGIISGYNCGAPPAGTCDSQNRPYFLPNNIITRGQAAKVITLALNYNDSIPANQQSFSDVPPESTFYSYVERAYMHQLISGYGCGAAPAGPCDPQNRPYFLPNNNITRGQAAKLNAVGFNCIMPSGPPGSCALHNQGDANCDGVVDLKDYFYYVRKVNGGSIPTSVNVDINNDTHVDTADRQIIVNKITGRAD